MFLSRLQREVEGRYRLPASQRALQIFGLVGAASTEIIIFPGYVYVAVKKIMVLNKSPAKITLNLSSEIAARYTFGLSEHSLGAELCTGDQ